MHISSAEITTICTVIGCMIAMGSMAFYVGRLVEKVDALIRQKDKDHTALSERITTVTLAMDRHEQWHIDNKGKGRHVR